jgi:hypothetical protein
LNGRHVGIILRIGIYRFRLCLILNAGVGTGNATQFNPVNFVETRIDSAGARQTTHASGLALRWKSF